MRTLLAFSVLLTVSALTTGCENSVGVSDGAFALQTRDALEILPAGVEMAGMVNLQAVRQSGLFNDRESPFSPENMEGENAARFNEFMRMTGFNPEEDVRRVYMAVSEENGEKSAPAFVIYATFDRDRIETYLEENTPDDVTRSAYRDIPVYMVDEEDGTFGFGILSDEMAVAGEEAVLHAMIDRVADGTQGLSGDSEMMALIEQAVHRDGAWFAVRTFEAGGNDHAADGPMAGLGQAATMMRSGVMSFGFEGDEVELVATGLPASNANPSDEADILRGTISLLRTTTQRDNPEMAAVLDGVRVRETGSAVQVQATLEPSFFEGLHNERKN